MKITIRQQNDNFICALPDGKEIEVMMVSMTGEDVYEETDLTKAVNFVQQSYAHFGYEPNS